MVDCTVSTTTTDTNPSIEIIHVKGMVSANGANKVSPEVMQVFEASPAPKGVIFDLAEAPFVSSGGIRMFLAAYKKGAALDIKVAMVRVQPSVYTVFKVAGLVGGFRIHESVEQALAGIWSLETAPQ